MQSGEPQEPRSSVRPFRAERKSGVPVWPKEHSEIKGRPHAAVGVKPSLQYQGMRQGPPTRQVTAVVRAAPPYSSSQDATAAAAVGSCVQLPLLFHLSATLSGAAGL